MNTNELINIWRNDSIMHILPTQELKTLYHINLLHLYREFSEDKYYLKIHRVWGYYLKSNRLYIPFVYKYKFYEVL